MIHDSFYALLCFYVHATPVDASVVNARTIISFDWPIRSEDMFRLVLCEKRTITHDLCSRHSAMPTWPRGAMSNRRSCSGRWQIAVLHQQMSGHERPRNGRGDVSRRMRLQRSTGPILSLVRPSKFSKAGFKPKPQLLISCRVAEG